MSATIPNRSAKPNPTLLQLFVVVWSSSGGPQRPEKKKKKLDSPLPPPSQTPNLLSKKAPSEHHLHLLRKETERWVGGKGGNGHTKKPTTHLGRKENTSQDIKPQTIRKEKNYLYPFPITHDYYQVLPPSPQNSPP